MLLREVELTSAQVLQEFDQWVTPTLGDLRQTTKFKMELQSLSTVLNSISMRVIGQGFSHHDAILAEAHEALLHQAVADQRARLSALITFVYLATAKSDNAVKCQYPIAFLSKNGDRYPLVSGRQLGYGVVPNVIKSTDIVSTTVRLNAIDKKVAAELLQDYLDFLLQDEDDLPQAISLIDAFGHAEEVRPGWGSKLLAPLVAFQVRGSVAASGGHNPEEFVRIHLREWGLLPTVHFNVADITARTLANWLHENDTSFAGEYAAPSGDKTRAFDFIIPYQLIGSECRIFVQSQFYAGDSGSVSHKNVDQAAGARRSAASLFPSAKFVELVDGAGYCASLRKDLQHLLFASDTQGFSQIRSIPIRFRRLMQQTGFFSPLDLALHIDGAARNRSEVLSYLRVSGASSADAQIQLDHACREGWLESEGEALNVSAMKAGIISEYKVLNTLAEHGRTLRASDLASEVVLIPGFGPNYGLPLHELQCDRNLVGSLVVKGLVSKTPIERT